jgi:hypothetical protein
MRTRTLLGVAALVVVAGAIVLWVVRYDRRMSQDGDAWLAEATDEARDWRADAQILRLEGHAVAPDGTTPLLEDFQLTWRYEFVSPGLGEERRADVVPGAPPPSRRPRCFGFSVSLSKIGRSRLDARGGATSCTSHESIAAPVRCSIRQVWQRARARGAPSPAYAEIRLTTSHGTRAWHFEIVDRVRSAAMFAIDLADDC